MSFNYLFDYFGHKRCRCALFMNSHLVDIHIRIKYRSVNTFSQLPHLCYYSWQTNTSTRIGILSLKNCNAYTACKCAYYRGHISNMVPDEWCSHQMAATSYKSRGGSSRFFARYSRHRRSRDLTWIMLFTSSFPIYPELVEGFFSFRLEPCTYPSYETHHSNPLLQWRRDFAHNFSGTSKEDWRHINNRVSSHRWWKLRQHSKGCKKARCTSHYPIQKESRPRDWI